MDNSFGTGFMAVFAVSGSVVLVALQVHKRLLSDFMKKMEFEMATSRKNQQNRKKVRFADDVVRHPFSDENAGTKDSSYYLESPAGGSRVVEEKLETLPLNWQALYKGIIESRVLKGVSQCRYM